MKDVSKNDLLSILVEQLATATAPPFLFVGSGFSLRYLGLPSWPQLLEKFCVGIKPYRYYHSSAGGDLPTVASLMAVDYFEYAWADEEKAKLLQEADIASKEDTLKFFIAKYISSQYESGEFECAHPEEVQKLEGLNVDAIITTNWDCYLEDIFPEYSTYVGQDELVVANPHGIGEIYKIHGSVEDHRSLVLTKDDYEQFEKKYAYLAAKLVTFLVEHPVVFIGYSIQDSNIQCILESLASCLGGSVQERLKNNLIFVQRCGEDRKEGIETTQFKVLDHHVPLTTVTTDDFCVIYDAINSIKRKIPAKILRFIKEEIYKIAISSNPERRILVSDIDDIDNNEEVEFVIGIGVRELHDHGMEAQATKKGYHIIPINEVLDDVLESKDNESRFNNIEELLKGTIGFHLKRSPYTPIFKYLRLLGINDDRGYRELGIDLGKAYDRKFDEFHFNNKYYVNAARGLDITKVIQDYPPQKAALVIPHLRINDIDIDELRAFLFTYQQWNVGEPEYKSFYRKLIAIYDRLKFGWID